MKSLLTALITLGVALTVGMAAAQQPIQIHPGEGLPSGVKVVPYDGQKIPAGAKVMKLDDAAMIDHLTKTLNLTPPQKKKVAAIHTELAKRLRASKGPEDFKKAFAWKDGEMKKVLSPAQFKKLQGTFHTRMSTGVK